MGLAEREDELFLDAGVALGIVQLRQEINRLAFVLLAKPENGLLPHFNIISRAGDVEKLRPPAGLPVCVSAKRTCLRIAVLESAS